MDAEAEFVDYLLDALAPLSVELGDISARKMFGGYGIFAETLAGKKMFALVADSELYLKADSENQGNFEALDMPPFQYDKGGEGGSERVKMAYFRAPPDALELSSELCAWARKSIAAAVRA